MENVKFLEIKSRYNEQKQHCSLAGTFMICGIEGRFEVHTIGSCCTRVTGRVSLISPLDGKIFLFDGARRRELIAKRAEDQKARIRTEKRPRELKATKELDVEIAGVDLDPMTHVVVFPQSANTAIKEAVAGKAERLYAEAQPTLARILENHGLGQNATALGLFYARSKAFFATEVPTKEQTRRRNQNSLQKICASLGDKPISCISAKDVTYLSKQFSNTELRRTARFFDFCKDRGDFACANPILEYMPTQKHTRNYSAERARAARMHGISGEAECALLKLAKDHIADGRVCAIVLALGAGLGIDEMRELYWRDVQCKNNQAYLELQSDNAGATHNYSRPPLPFAQEILRARYDWLHEHYTRGFSNFPVVSDRDDPRRSISRSALTDFIRASFQRCGVRFSALDLEDSTSKQIGGTGIRLAKEHYENVLAQICGIPADSQESRYFCGKPMDTVTADCYRGLSGVSGQNYLETVVRRDTRFSDDTDDGYTVDKEDIGDGMCRYTIHPNNFAAQIGLIAEMRLKPDNHMSIECPNGLAGILKAK